MEHIEEFPFLVGQKVESKSNIKGYRGAWFRCEIKDLHLRRGEIWCAMQYSDFPDEKVSSTKAYQQDPTGRKRRALMLRPSYPTICWGLESFGIDDSAGAVVVINGDWQVGDLVDWFSDGCYWGAKIIAVTNRDFVQIELPSPPAGEGGRYEAAVKDIRPLLDWSPEQLWRVPGCKLFSNHQNESLVMNYIHPGLTGDADQFEMEKKEHFFIAKQEPLKTTVIRGPKFNMDHEVHLKRNLKRKVSVLESDHMTGGNYVPELGYSNNSNVFGDMMDAVAKSTYSTASTQPLMGEFRDNPAIGLANTSVGNLASHMGNNTGIVSQISRTNNVGIDNDTAFGNAFTLLNKKDQLNSPWAQCSGEHLLEVKYSEQDKKGKDCEEKIDQISLLRGSRYIDLESFTLQVDEYETSRQAEQQLLGMEDKMETTTSDIKHFINSTQEGISSSITAGEVFDQDVDTLVGEGKYLDVDEASIGSSITTLEELLSRVVWLKGVLQLGLKGWSQERNKKKWTLCEQEAQPDGDFKQDVQFASIHQVSDKAMLGGVTRSLA